MPSEFHLIRVADKLEASTQPVQQLAAWAKRLPKIFAYDSTVHPHHDDCRALSMGDQSKCNCADLNSMTSE
jgi:hypothetical protein